MSHNHKTVLRVFLNLQLLLVRLQNFTIAAAASLAKHFNFPTYANICYFNRKVLQTWRFILTPYYIQYQEQFLYVISCNKEVSSICLTTYFSVFIYKS